MNRHSLRVARNFPPLSRAWFLALMHDVPERHPFMRWMCRLWPALDAITRRDGETYLTGYIPRVANSHLATVVKLADIGDNLTRTDGVKSRTYTDRLRKAARYLIAARKDMQ